MLQPSELVLFIDLETVPVFPTFAEMPPEGQAAFARKMARQFGDKKYDDMEHAYKENASLMAEFAQIVSISAFNSKVNPDRTGRIPTICTHLTLGWNYSSEIDLLKAFCKSIDIHKADLILCAHSGKSFDFPFLCRRMLIHGLEIPEPLQVWGKKPWDVSLMDTSELWKFTDIKSYTSLVVLCYALGVPSPKSTMDGSKVADAFRTGQYKEIGSYCLLDSIAMANCYYKMLKEPIYVSAEPV